MNLRVQNYYQQLDKVMCSTSCVVAVL